MLFLNVATIANGFAAALHVVSTGELGTDDAVAISFAILALATMATTPTSASPTVSGVGSIVRFPIPQVQHAWRHAPAFGVSGNWSAAAGFRFIVSMRQFLSSPSIVRIVATYRGSPATIYLNPATRLMVMTDPADVFIGAWRLNAQQLANVLTRGSLGGG